MIPCQIFIAPVDFVDLRVYDVGSIWPHRTVERGNALPGKHTYFRYLSTKLTSGEIL